MSDTFSLEVHVFEREGVSDFKTVKGVRELNLKLTKQFIESGGHADAIMYLVTEENVYYCALDQRAAAEAKSSPLDQVSPVLHMITKQDERFKDLLAYQIIGEAWMKVFKKNGKDPPIEYGDIAVMPDRVEVLMEVFVEKDLPMKCNTFKMIREVDSEKVIDFNLINSNDNTMESTKFPLLPITGDYNA